MNPFRLTKLQSIYSVTTRANGMSCMKCYIQYFFGLALGCQENNNQ